MIIGKIYYEQCNSTNKEGDSMKTWGIFVICFGLYTVMLAPLYNTLPLMISSGLFFIVVGVLVCYKGRNKK